MKAFNILIMISYCFKFKNNSGCYIVIHIYVYIGNQVYDHQKFYA